MNRGIVRIVQEMAETFTEDFLGSLRERNMDLKSGCVVFVGGGASFAGEIFFSAFDCAS